MLSRRERGKETFTDPETQSARDEDHGWSPTRLTQELLGPLHQDGPEVRQRQVPAAEAVLSQRDGPHGMGRLQQLLPEELLAL